MQVPLSGRRTLYAAALDTDQASIHLLVRILRCSKQILAMDDREGKINGF
jgi:hypothetical protein